LVDAIMQRLAAGLSGAEHFSFVLVQLEQLALEGVVESRAQGFQLASDVASALVKLRLADEWAVARFAPE